MLGPRGRTQAPPQAPRRGIRPNRPSKRRQTLPPLPQTTGVSFPGLLRQLPQHKPWMITISVISVLVVLGACGFGSWQLIKQEGQAVGVIQGGPTVQRRDISSREVDNQPLTLELVFPTTEVSAAEPDLPPYTMVGEPQADDDCRYVGDEEVKALLEGTVDPADSASPAVCSQFLRASFLSYDNRYHATIGVLNISDMDEANTVANEIKNFGESGEGTLTGYVSDPRVNAVLFSAPPHLHMEVYGHFLLYGVVVHKDGSDMAADDQGAKIVVYDLVQTYLLNMIKNWALVPAGAEGSAQPTTSGSPTS
jgi:hypothetical protein